MTRTTEKTERRLEELKAEEEKLKKEYETLIHRKTRCEIVISKTKRKLRTRRLIERGAILESLIPNPEILSNEQIKALLKAALAHAQACHISANQPDENAEV